MASVISTILDYSLQEKFKALIKIAMEHFKRGIWLLDIGIRDIARHSQNIGLQQAQMTSSLYMYDELNRIQMSQKKMN